MKKNAKVEIHYEKPVWVNPTTEFIRRDECLCLNCTKLHPGTVNNCRIAQKLYDVCLFDAVALIVTRCPEYQPKTLVKDDPVIEGAKDYLSMKGESGGPIGCSKCGGDCEGHDEKPVSPPGRVRRDFQTD